MTEQDNDLKMVNGGVLSSAELMQAIERIEKLNDDHEIIASDIRQLYAEVKSRGFDPKYIRAIIKLRKLAPDQIYEQDELMAMYRKAANI